MSSRSNLTGLTPDVHWPALQGFWEGARNHEVRLPRCRACERFNWYPIPSCRFCGQSEFEWVTLSGTGTLFAWAVVRRALHPAFAELVPYVSAIVTLAEDETVRMVGRLLVDADHPLKVGARVRASFVDLGHPVAETGVTGVLWSLEQEDAAPCRGRLPASCHTR
jgi:uncharacterized protein